MYSDLSNFQSENAKLSIGRVDGGPYIYLIDKITNSLLMMRMNENDKSISVNAQVKGTWGSEKKLATKDDLNNMVNWTTPEASKHIALAYDFNTNKIGVWKDGTFIREF